MVLPLTDTVLPRRFPLVTAALVVANVAVWLLYQLPAGIDESVETLGTYACSIDGSCPEPTALPWPLAVVTAMFTHGSWSHLIGNMIFLIVFGPRVEDAVGRVRYALVYAVAGVGAELIWVGTMLAFATAEEMFIPAVGASGAISGVIGAYLVLFPFQRVLTWVMPAFFLRIPALGLLGVWFALQALEGTYTMSHPETVVGIAFMAHVGGFVVGALAGLAHRRGARSPGAAAPSA